MCRGQSSWYMDVYRCEGLREENTKMFARRFSEDYLTLLLLTAQM